MSNVIEGLALVADICREKHFGTARGRFATLFDIRTRLRIDFGWFSSGQTRLPVLPLAHDGHADTGNAPTVLFVRVEDSKDGQS